MPRFVARSVIVEAHQYCGHTHTMPEAFRLAVRRHNVGGVIDVMTGDGLRSCKHEDWILRGPDGTFSVLRNATFETMFEAEPALASLPASHQPPAPTSLSIPGPARVDTRRKAHV